MKYFSTLKALCVLVCLVCFHQTGQSQCDTNCSISCTGQLNPSLGNGCEAEITPWMGGKSIEVGDTICHSVVVYDQHNQIIPNNIVNISHVNKLLTFKVTENECNNFCWGNVLVEYKQGPQLVCPPDLTLECNALDLFQLPLPTDLCASVDISLISEVHNDIECDENFQGVVTRTYRAVDEFGNTNTCAHDIFLRRVPISEIIFPDFTTLLCSDENIVYDANGFPLPFFFNSMTDSLSVFGVPFLCSSTVETPYSCPGAGVPMINDCGSIITSIGNGGLVSIGLSMLNPSVSASCIAGQFTLSFSPSATVSSLDFDCSTVGVNPYTIYLLDGNSVVSTCQNTIQITDPSNTCFGGSTGSGTGTTTTTGGGITTSTGISSGCTFGIPLFPESGGVILTETNNGGLVDVNAEQVGGSLSQLCGSVLLYNDVEFSGGKNTCTRKIFRTWEAYEWTCGEEIHISSVQIIEIIDDRPPVFDCPSDLTVSTSVDCGANIQLPNLNAFDDCGSKITVTMEYPNGVVTGDNQIVDLNAGSNPITFVVSDECRNSSSCTVNYTIMDYTNPVAICEQEKVIALGTGDSTRVPADLFDLGSFDDCGIDKMLVRRQDNNCNPDADKFGDYAYFCCADAIAGVVPVEFRVVDKGGNTSDCIVFVEIQDKANPIVNCPPDRTVDCRDTYSSQNLGITFGNATTSSTCNNAIPTELVETSFDQCEVGSMTRTFQVLSFEGAVLASCKQLITIENPDPFVGSDIIWPLDVTVTDLCDVALLTPENLEAPFNFPTFAPGSDQCAQLGIDYDDQVFTADPSSGDCAIIQRTWTVINWCSALSDFETFVIPVPQLIKIRNTTAPVMDETLSLVFSGAEVDCNSGQVDIVRTATDDCDNNLSWTFSIKRASDGALVQTGNSPEIRGKYPVGSYNIEWRVFDDCGNFDFQIQNIQIRSDKPPTPVCLSGLSAKLVDWDTDGDGIPDLKQTTLNAVDFNAGSYPNCGNEIGFSFSSDVTDITRSFTCADLGRNNVELWATDQLTGAQSFCVGFIDVQDDGDCPQQITATLAGQVLTELQQEVENVEVHLENGNAMELTDEIGAYAFPSMPTGGDYEVRPLKDTDYLDGVSTLDLIMIQRHILGIETFDSPYKYLAADVDGNENIDGIDLVELRKLVLGIYTELPQNDSWRFVSADYQFADPFNPWLADISETYQLIDLSSNRVVDFVGVKVGDVNNDAVLYFDDALSNRSNSVVNLAVPTQSLEKDKLESLMVYSSNYQGLSGWQGTLEYDADVLEIVEVLPQSLSLSTINYNINQEAGYVTFSYHNATTEDVEYGSPLFELKVRAKSEVTSAREFIEMTSSVIKAEAYNIDEGVSELAVVEYITDQSRILSVNPNPFIETAELQYYSPYSNEVAEFEFYDLNGQLLFKSSVHSDLGINNLTVNKEDLAVSGFVYVRMQIQGEVSDFRMILL